MSFSRRSGMFAHPLRLLGWPGEIGRTHLDPGGPEELAVEEARALTSIDSIVLFEDADLERGDLSLLPFRMQGPLRASDDLRLPPPPLRALDGETLFRSVEQAVATLSEAPNEGARAASDPEDPRASMVSLLSGILELETEIREKLRRARRV